ncbi:uncharacterized protein F4822DRAFT_403140 [Hypoxylon trugodes]|uniref:uncharacterized protein n=1 Tax=Hypoxylon trugodes TaxID=326681 RepID=UPI00219B8B36|nr:uncharacterized protein F4822DRAFT_403140 [Hypoxylon trugodes]KAI1388546.1 hypothetical protein F4822DRAFT_403140 [Hypoxylon trugodes]
MDSLPVEILNQIFSYFCFHCQHSRFFPNADLEEVRRDKKQLAHLCLVSKGVCSVAQPILYHFYATGNSRVETKIYQGYDDIKKRPWENDYLPQFVRTIAQRPDLASRVTAMHIVRGGELTGYESQMEEIESLFDFSVDNNLLPKPHLPEDWIDGRFSEWRDSQREWLHLWLTTLAIVLSTRLDKLLLSIDHNAEFSELEYARHIKLPSLRTLGLIRNTTDYHFNELEALYAAAPNLENIYACDAAGWSKYVVKSYYSGYKYELALPNIKKLVISDLIPEHLGNLLPCVPKLEDLEYYWDGDNEFDVEDLTELFQPVKKTLSRLSIVAPPRNFPPFRLEPLPTFIESPRVDYPPLRTFRGFDKLEDLSIDCYLIYREHDSDEADRLTTLLPRSIRKLRISYMYKSMDRALLQLAADAPEDFPAFKEITIGVAERTNPIRLDLTPDAKKLLDKAFNESGIKISWKKDFLGPDPRTTIPGAMVRSRLIPVPQVMDALEDYELEVETQPDEKNSFDWISTRASRSLFGTHLRVCERDGASRKRCHLSTLHPDTRRVR